MQLTPKIPSDAHLHIRISEILLSKITKFATARGMSRSDTVRQILEQAIAEMEQRDGQ